MSEKLLFNGRYFKIEKIYNRIGDKITALISSGKGEKYIYKSFCVNSCEYDNFADKIEFVRTSYNTLANLVPIPKIITFSFEERAFIREFIEGNTLNEINIDEFDNLDINSKIFEFNNKLEQKGYSVHFDPDKYIFADNVLYYLGYSLEKNDI